MKALHLMNRHKFYSLLLSSLLLPVVYAEGQKTIEVIPTKTIPSIDGKSDDVMSLMTSYNFFQLEPDNGASSPSETKIVVMQSADTLYIAFACFQRSAVTAKIQLRDKFALSDDGIYLILGTFNDNRNEYDSDIAYIKLTYSLSF